MDGAARTLGFIVERFHGLKALVIGDVMLDHYLHGEVGRVSPEAPVPVVLVSREDWRAGGAANVALNITSLGMRASLLGRFSNDENGETLLDLLAKGSVKVIGPRSGSTSVKSRVFARGQQVCRVDREEILTGPWDEELPAKAMRESHIVIISDYAKGFVCQEALDQAVKSSAKIVAVDPKPGTGLSYSGANLLKLNKEEACSISNLPSGSLEEVFKRLYEMHRVENIVVTLGGDGMAIGTKGVFQEVVKEECSEVYDVSGAGDTVISVLSAALASGVSLRLAARLAGLAASCVIGHVGTTPIKKNDLLKKIEDAHD